MKEFQKDGKNSQAYAWRACAIGQGLTRGFLDDNPERNWALAKESVEKAMQLNDNDFECHRMLAEVSLSSHDYKSAEMHATKCFEMVPNDPRVLSIHGEVLVRVGSVDAGLESLERALELDPVPQGKNNSDARISAVLFGNFMARDKDKCLTFINKMQLVDVRSWLVTAKILDDEEVNYKSYKWFQDGLDLFQNSDWTHEVDRFHLNNDGAQIALEQFAISLFK